MRALFRIILLTALIAGVSACAPREAVELVVIGNAFGSNTIPQLYEAAVAEDMDAKVNTYSWMKPAASPATYLENLQTETELRKAVKNADVILISFSPSWGNAADNMFFNDLCGGEDNQDCLRETVAKTMCEWKGIMDTIVELRAGEPLVFHVVVWGDWIFSAFYDDNVTPGQISVMAAYFNEFQVSTPGIQFVTVFPEPYTTLPPEYFRTDGSHQLSEEGSRAAVELILSPGLDPSLPGSPDLTDESPDCASISK